MLRQIATLLLSMFSSGTALLGAILVGWNGIEIYYLVTGRVVTDFEQPPLAVVSVFFVAGLIMLFGGHILRWWLRSDDPL